MPNAPAPAAKAVAAAPFVFFNPADYKKLVGLVLLMCGLAHARRKEMQKRWLKPGQEPRLIVDHPAFAYLLENGALFGLAYIYLRYMPTFSQTNPVRSLAIGMLSSVIMVEPLILFEKFCATVLYPHVPYFSERTVPHDWYTMLTDYLQCNLPAAAAGNVLLTYQLCTMPKAVFESKILETKPIQLVPFLAKYLFTRLAVDVVFGIAHRAMHDVPSIYTWIHKRHHEHTTPQSPTNFHFHWIDIFMEAFFPVQVAFIALQATGYAATRTEQIALGTAMIYYESASHTGKEVPTVTWFPLMSPLVDMLTGCDQRLIEYHTRHHQLYRCNYSISPWMDKLLGTYRIDLPESYGGGKKEENTAL